ncbi:MAG TPA: Cys-tRNA(Pro) deacylase [Microbacteriaceae bacterium]|nr:Cys-tRNA(Pro) deacylase [Microbacteriaceae bacterium]
MSHTPAMVRCDGAGVAYSVHRYRHNPSASSYGLEAAEQLGLDPAAVFKTLIVALDITLGVAVVPVSGLLDLKACAAAFGSKKAELADPAIARRKTGYVIGGISPIGQKTSLPTVIDESALALETIYVSAGVRGADIGLSPLDLAELTGADFARIARA